MLIEKSFVREILCRVNTVLIFGPGVPEISKKRALQSSLVKGPKLGKDYSKSDARIIFLNLWECVSCV